jgi:hypothetical protein
MSRSYTSSLPVPLHRLCCGTATNREEGGKSIIVWVLETANVNLFHPNLTKRVKFLLEKLIVIQLVKKYSAFGCLYFILRRSFRLRLGLYSVK